MHKFSNTIFNIILILIDDLINGIRNAFSYWHIESAEALHCTPIDLVLFDRLSSMKHMCDPITKNPVLEGARPLVLKGEQPITTVCLGEEPNTSGVADYVIGYPYKVGIGEEEQMESIYCAVEAKKELTFE